MTIPKLSNKHSARAKGGRHVEHVYAIVRIDDFLGADVPTEHRVTVKKVVRDADEAEREVERLNRLQEDAGVHYFTQTTRLENPDQVTPIEEDTGQTNRISAFASGQATDTITPDPRAWLETVRIPEYIYLPPPRGFGFPAVRAYEVIGNPDHIHQIKYKDLSEFICTMISEDYVDVVGVTDHEDYSMVTFAFRVFPDLCDDPLSKLTLLTIVEQMVDRFGMTMYVGSQRGKSFLEREFPLPNILVPGTPDGQIISIENPDKHPFVIASALKITPPTVRIAMAFCFDIMKYWEWIKDR